MYKAELARKMSIILKNQIIQSQNDNKEIFDIVYDSEIMNMAAMLYYGTEEQVKAVLAKDYKSDEYKIIANEEEENIRSMSAKEIYTELLNEKEYIDKSKEEFEQYRKKSIENLEKEINKGRLIKIHITIPPTGYVTIVTRDNKVKNVPEKMIFSSNDINKKKIKAIITNEKIKEIPSVENPDSYFEYLEYLILNCELENIGEWAFAVSKIKELICPPNLKNIGKCAFRESEVETIKFSASVKKIESECFGLCKKLKKVELNEGLKELGDYAFTKSAVEIINFPSTLKTIPAYCLEDCVNLKTANLSEGLEKIGQSAFAHSTIEIINFPSTLKEISEYCFCTCWNLKTANLREGLKKIERDAFKNSTIEIINFPSTLEEIAGECFSECCNLKIVNLNEGLKKIGEYAFEKSGVQIINFPSTLKYMRKGSIL